MIDENTIIKDESGSKIEMIKLMELMNSGEWTMDPVEDKGGKLLYMQLRKTTEEENKMMSEMPMQGNESEFIGKTAPNFTVKDLNDNDISIESTKGKIVVLNFWFTSCKPCIDEIPELNKVYKKYKNNINVVFASITFDKKEKVEAFLKKYPIKYPVVSDAKEVCDLFKVFGYPTNIVIDKNGNYYTHLSGGFPQIGNQLSSSIQNALDGKEPLLNSMPSDGIVIDELAIYRLENGEIVQPEKVIDLLNTNKYDFLPQNENGEDFYLLKEK